MRSIKISRVQDLIRKYGIVGFLKKALYKVCTFVFSYRPLNFYGIEALTQSDIQAGCPLEIRKGGSEDLELVVGLLDYMDESVARGRAQRAFNKGAELFLAFSEGKLAHVCWVFYSPGVREILVNVKLKSDEAHIATAYTSPEFRGNNIYPAVLQHILRYTTIEKGINRAYIASLPSNIASVRGIEKAGFSKVATIRGFMLFGKMFNCNWESK